MTLMKTIDNQKQEKIWRILKQTKNIVNQKDQIFFSPLKKTNPTEMIDSPLITRIQTFLKKYGRSYNVLVDSFSPVFFNPLILHKFNKLLKSYAVKDTILNVGSGPTYFMNRRDIINIDLFAFNEVDIVADIHRLPIKDACVDLIVNLAVLEHVADPQQVVKEMYRVTKKHGKIICYVPFIVPFHVAPQDFYRWTKTGVKELFSDFKIMEIIICGGPTSAMLWILQEWLAILLSFGSRTLHDILFLFFMMITFPIKFLDALLVVFPYASHIASGFYIIAEKEDTE